ncbi:MAG TPA: 8-oxoguanine deaminase [Actinomycetes bacterium]|jgi:cytosine/adenosine deaminase-related metal-dependent hydrolase|nr:8-oxoguanine deaminase [Actinomycetes bacterium]
MIVIEGCAIAAADAAGTEYASGYVVIEDERIVAVGGGQAPARHGRAWRVDGRGCLATPGLVNCHHHLYQWATRGLAQQANLFEWLTELYPVWACLDAELELAAARAGIAALLTSGCSTSSDHHYVFPPDAGDPLAAEVAAAAGLGIRFHPCRGSMDLGRSRGGLPPDEIVEDRDTVLAATEAAIDRYHDPSPGSMLRVAVAPCSPFSVTGELMREAAALARRRGVRLHTHLAETLEEQAYCSERFGRTPAEYLDDLGWLGDDVWLAHCVHLDGPSVRRFGDTGTAVAHCPSSNARLGAGIAPVADLLRAGAPVGLGVDGAASNESGQLGPELRQALLVARLRDGPAALTARQALALGTSGGASCLGRRDELGSLEPGKLADVALWRVDDLGHADVADPVAALVLGPPARVELLLVGGRAVVEDGELRTGSEVDIARDALAASRRLLRVAEAIT